jgi:hypothetical protein
VTAHTEADQAVRLAPGILSPRKITIKGAQSASPHTPNFAALPSHAIGYADP